MNKTKEEIKPCPFCGSTDIEFIHFDYTNGGLYSDKEKTGLQCNNCDAIGGIDSHDIIYDRGAVMNDYNALKKKAIEKWNTRFTGVKKVDEEKRNKQWYISKLLSMDIFNLIEEEPFDLNNWTLEECKSVYTQFANNNNRKSNA